MSINQEEVLAKLAEKSVTKQKVYQNTKEVFGDFKEMGKALIDDYKNQMKDVDPAIRLDFKDVSKFDMEMTFAGDMLVASMHSNVFQFPSDSYILNSSYVKENEFRSYCGIIRLYNFLSDSYKYNRINDLGFLVARIFVNCEKHFFVEAKGELGIQFNNFHSEVIDKEIIKKILETSMGYCIDFDLHIPPQQNEYIITLQDMKSANQQVKLKTGKRLGFKMENTEE